MRWVTRFGLLNAMLRSHQMPPVHWEHTLVKKNPDVLVLPYSLYFDVTQYGGKAAAGRQQGVLVVSVRNLLTKKRHRVATIRKGMFCKCGCHGDCTVAMLEFSCIGVQRRWPMVLSQIVISTTNR